MKKTRRHSKVIDLVTPEIIDLVSETPEVKNSFFKKMNNGLSLEPFSFYENEKKSEIGKKRKSRSSSSKSKKRQKIRKTKSPSPQIKPMFFLEEKGLKEQKQPKQILTTFKPVSSETRKKRIQEITEKNALKNVITKVGRNFKKDVFHANYLKHVCSDSGECMAFGKEISVVKRLFEGFLNFDFIASPIQRIGEASANGIINLIHFKRHNYNAYAVLKSSLKENADNLMYEYEVGKNFINYFVQVFPCFLETYGLFFHNFTKGYKKLQKENLPIIEFQNLGLTQELIIDYDNACASPTMFCVLTQHIQSNFSVQKFIKDKIQVFQPNSLPDTKVIIENYVNLNWELPKILYQIYMPLSVLRNNFTHYDLHSNNVLLYGPLNGYIDFHYHLNNSQIIQFPSQYIAKIIDYGRAYYKNDDINASSEQTYQEMCQMANCNPDCGKFKGFGYLGKLPQPDSYIASRFRNISHDLRLLKIIKDKVFSIDYISSKFKQLLSKVIFNGLYGTKENPDMNSGNIVNVVDASKELSMYLSSNEFENHKIVMYSQYKKIGEFHIYEDMRPMTFTSAKNP
jgi:hypothetical protein